MFIKNLNSLGLTDEQLRPFAEKLAVAAKRREESWHSPKRADDAAGYRMTFLTAAYGDETVAQALYHSRRECEELCARLGIVMMPGA